MIEREISNSRRREEEEQIDKVDDKLKVNFEKKSSEINDDEIDERKKRDLSYTRALDDVSRYTLNKYRSSLENTNDKIDFDTMYSISSLVNSVFEQIKVEHMDYSKKIDNHIADSISDLKKQIESEVKDKIEEK